MEKIQYSEGAVSEELDAQQETLDEARAEEIGAALMRAMEIASMAVDEKKISLENLSTMISVFDGHQDDIELNDEQQQKFEEAIKVYLNEVNNEKTWSEALSVLVPIGIVRRDEMISFLDGGMPIEIILNNEQYLDCLTENGTQFKTFPVGLLGRIYKEMSATDKGRERFEELFIEDHKMDLALGNNVFDAMESGEKIGPEQRADIEVFREMGGDVLFSMADSCSMKTEDTDLEMDPGEQIANRREVGRQFFDYLMDEGLINSGDASLAFETTRKDLAEGRWIDTITRGVMLECAIESDLSLHSDDEDTNYWMDICKQKRENVFWAFNAIVMNEKNVSLNDFDFDDIHAIRLLADVLGNNSISWPGSPRLYEEIDEKGLLDSEAFKEELVRAIGKRCEADGIADADDGYSIKSLFSERRSMAVNVLAARRGVLEELSAQGLFDKYPQCKNNKTIRKVVNGSFTEKDRLGLFGYGFVGDEFYDENGEVNDYFFSGCWGVDDFAKVLDDNEARRLCEYCLGVSDYLRLSSIGGDFLDRGNVHGPVRGLIDNYERLRLNEFSLGWLKTESEDFASYFDESGAKWSFWQECARRKESAYLKEMDGVGYDKATKMVLFGMTDSALGEVGEVTEDNILSALTRFIYKNARGWDGSSEADLKIKEAFSESNLANKDEAMRQLRKIYEDYLKSSAETPFPDSLAMLANYMHKSNGAGPLTQIEAFLDYCGALSEAGGEGLKKGAARVEGKIKDWDNVDRANFYATGAEILSADPRLYEEFIEVFDRLDDSRDFKMFAQEIFPLFRAKLALLRSYEDHSNGIGVGYQDISYRDVDMDQLCNDLHKLLIPFTFMSRGDDEGEKAFRERREKGFVAVKEGLFGEISGLFTEKFGIIPEAIPGDLDKEGMRSVEDMVLYLSNIAHQSVQKKNLIGYYLALQLSKREDGLTMWDAFRKGEDCNPSDYLVSDAAQAVADQIRRSNEMSPLTAENTKISSEGRLREFRGALQEETSEIRVGSVSTVDVRLQDLKGNIEELVDPDLYDNAMDRAKVAIIGRYPPKMIGKVATALWQREAKGGEPAFSETETALADELIKLLADAELEVTPENIQKYLQQGFKELGPVAKTLALIRESDVTKKVAELQDMLIPQGEVATIFGELGEQFRPKSGVLALNADLEFLDGIVSKGKKNGAFSGDPVEQARKFGVVKGYLDAIEQRMAELDGIYSVIAKSFESIRVPNEGEGSNRAVAEKIQEIRRIINGGGVNDSVIISTCSINMNTIIENMRACLSCKTKGINNDTNLTFGESYKFYVYSQNGVKEGGSISDEVVYFVPTGQGDDLRMSFVMDRIYGTKNSDVLLGHVGVLAKKARALKDKYPEVPISIFVTTNGASSCSVPIDSGNLLTHLASIEGVTVRSSTREVNIPESGYGDHYIEIGGDTRTSGPRMVYGVEVIFD